MALVGFLTLINPDEGVEGIVQDQHYSIGGYLSSDAPEYRGPTHFTPDSIPVIINCEGTYMGANLTVDPIPTSYGYIMQDGSGLMVV